MAEQERLVLSGEGGDADLSERTVALAELLSRLNRENSSLNSELASATSKYEFRQEQLTKNKENLARLNGESERLSAALTEATDAAASLDKEIDRLEQAHKEKTAALQENELELKRLMQRTQDLAARQADAHFRVHSAATRLNMLNEMAAGYEGFFPGVKALMAANRKGKAPAGLIGVVAELINVPPVYRVALEAHLGSNLQNIVCENAAAARGCCGVS